MEKFFKLKERGASVRTEFIAGMTTFFAMVCIVISLFCGDAKKIKGSSRGIAALFVAMLLTY